MCCESKRQRLNVFECYSVLIPAALFIFPFHVFKLFDSWDPSPPILKGLSDCPVTRILSLYLTLFIGKPFFGPFQHVLQQLNGDFILQLFLHLAMTMCYPCGWYCRESKPTALGPICVLYTLLWTVWSNIHCNHWVRCNLESCTLGSCKFAFYLYSYLQVQ